MEATVTSIVCPGFVNGGRSAVTVRGRGLLATERATMPVPSSAKNSRFAAEPLTVT